MKRGYFLNTEFAVDRADYTVSVTTSMSAYAKIKGSGQMLRLDTLFLKKFLGTVISAPDRNIVVYQRRGKWKIRDCKYNKTRTLEQKKVK